VTSVGGTLFHEVRRLLMVDKITALLPHKNHGSYFLEDCPHCKAGAEIERLATVNAALMKQLAWWKQSALSSDQTGQKS